MNRQLLLAYYGDDFTGSTDALEFLSRAGARTALFIEPPTATQLAAYPRLDAIGVAGLTRAMRPDAMQTVLEPAFARLRELQPRHVHYKVCSTFDSSPTIGSIGRAIEVGRRVFPNAFIPLLVAAPPLGRYCAFGNLFARLGIGSEGGIFRLDRHPSMSQHPTTPADESDLRLHLARQTSLQTGLLDILQIARPLAEMQESLAAQVQAGAEIILFDALYEEQLLGIGAAVDSAATESKPLFSVGSSGIEMALGRLWAQRGTLQPVSEWPAPGRAAPLLVVSGSCSPVTAGQVAWARANGFAEVVLDAHQLAASTETDVSSALLHYQQQVIGYLRQNQSVIVHTNGGAAGAGQSLPAETLGTALGLIARTAVQQTGVRRVVVAGGDTSSYAARAMGIEAVEMLAPFYPGAPLCRASAPDSPLHGVEVNFKGGQVGAPGYFGVLLEGRMPE
ncbi:four-carbon acid sugar kinase family protein [Hymenobacter properus]|uniref:Four-carbon acid sugar kinase family protein n=1 Tax=Hymenobacter properus TaxID=2791026 RepID=A0A931BGY4_9BACT|nr:four-carbon acid sugar kinase family protein [Hymenobacter properus]MBF9141082.1 four-carbon acid sugar kinase family protein [Hymenobacter properus]MBR7719891.1 four-carbon acid sugar kinase family protein [Microvirga sp. SRT04]